MSGGFPIIGNICNGIDIGSVLTTTLPTTVSAAQNAPSGTWTTIIASTPFDCAFAIIQIAPPQGSSFLSAVDVAVGATSNQVIIFNQLLATGPTVEGNPGFYYLPCNIPKGTRISARANSSAGTDGPALSMILFDGELNTTTGFGGIDALGFTRAATSMTTATASATANAKGSWTQLGSAATPRDYAGLILKFGPPAQATGATSAYFFVDIGIGASSNQLTIIPNLWVSAIGSATYPFPSNTPLIPIKIPAGRNLWMRCQSETASAVLGVVAYGLYQ